MRTMSKRLSMRVGSGVLEGSTARTREARDSMVEALPLIVGGFGVWGV